MSDPNEPAFPGPGDPRFVANSGERLLKSDYGFPIEPFHGLTKRELFAAMAMQAFCHPGHNNLSVNISAQAAVEVADALIAELNKPKGGGA